MWGSPDFFLGSRRAPLDKAALADRLAFDEPDFAPTHWLTGSEGAIAVNDKGEAALIKPLGDDLATRRFNLQSLKCRSEGALIVIDAPDHTFSAMSVAAADKDEAQRWMMRLEGASG